MLAPVNVTHTLTGALLRQTRVRARVCVCVRTGAHHVRTHTSTQTLYVSTVTCSHTCPHEPMQHSIQFHRNVPGQTWYVPPSFNQAGEAGCASSATTLAGTIGCEHTTQHTTCAAEELIITAPPHPRSIATSVLLRCTQFWHSVKDNVALIAFRDTSRFLNEMAVVNDPKELAEYEYVITCSISVTVIAVFSETRTSICYQKNNRTWLAAKPI